MAIVEINLNPTERELKWFGVMMALALGIIGAMAYVRFEAPRVAWVMWGLAPLVASVYYALRPLRRAMYRTWMYALYPVGWTVSHLVLSVVYYLVLTPIGLIMRLFGRDPMTRALDRESSTYWAAHRSAERAARYLRQF